MRVKHVLIAAAALLASVAQLEAAPVTLEFTSGGGGMIGRVGAPFGTTINTYTEDGFDFRTQQTVNHLEFFGTPNATTWSASPVGSMPWHRGGSNPIDPNVIEGSFGGAGFDVLSLDLVVNPLGMSFASSSGGSHAVAGGTLGTVNFAALGASWQNVNWITMTIGAGNASAIHAIDNFVFSEASPVPEPATLALMGLGGIGLVGGAIRKRRKAAATA